MKKISILHWTTSPINLYSPGGLEVVELEQLKRLNRSLEAKLFAPKIIGHIDNAFAIKHFGFLMKYDLFYYYNFLKINKDADYYIGQNSPLLALFESKKTIIYFHNYIKFLGRNIFLPFYSIFKKRYNKSKYIFCSDFLKNEFLSLYPNFNKSRLFVNYNGVEENQDKRTEGFGENKSIVFMGQWNYDKGFDLIIDAVKKIREIRQDFTLHLIGSGDLWNNKKKSHNCQISNCDYIKLVGKLPHDRLIDYIKDKDILVVPARWKEPFGMVAIEGLSAGMIVLTSGEGGLKDIIKDNYNGFIFKNGDVDSFVQKLDNSLSLNAQQIDIIRKNGYYDIKDKFNWEAHIKRLSDVLALE